MCSPVRQPGNREGGVGQSPQVSVFSETLGRAPRAGVWQT